MQRESTIIGDKEYAYYKIGMFKANSILLKLQKVVLPAIGETQKSGNMLDMDIGAMFEVVSSKLDDSVMTDIILPMLKESQCASVTDNLKLDSQRNIDTVFVDADGLADFYTLVFEVMKYNFSGFFTRLGELFGSQNTEVKTK